MNDIKKEFEEKFILDESYSDKSTVFNHLDRQMTFNHLWSWFESKLTQHQESLRVGRAEEIMKAVRLAKILWVKELREKGESMKKKDTTTKDLRDGTYRRGDDEYRNGFNEALDQIINLLPKGSTSRTPKSPKGKMKYKHLRLLIIQSEFPNNPGYSGTLTQEQYAYFLNEETGEVVKKKITQLPPAPTSKGNRPLRSPKKGNK